MVGSADWESLGRYLGLVKLSQGQWDPLFALDSQSGLIVGLARLHPR